MAKGHSERVQRVARVVGSGCVVEYSRITAADNEYYSIVHRHVGAWRASLRHAPKDGFGHSTGTLGTEL